MWKLRISQFLGQKIAMHIAIFWPKACDIRNFEPYNCELHYSATKKAEKSFKKRALLVTARDQAF